MRGTNRHANCGARYLLLAAIGLATLGHAEESAPALEPASMSEDVRATLEGLDLPLSDGKGPLTIRCTTRVLSGGDTEQVVCQPDRDRGGLVQRHSIAITRALNGKEFTPARVAGEPVRSLFNFSVVVFEADGETRIRALPHHGANVERFGTSRYSAPQRYTFPGWRCSFRASFTRVKYFIAVVRVSATGEPLEVEFAHPMPTGPCFDRIETVLMSSRYIPARVNGENAEALYLEMERLQDPLWDIQF